MDKIKKYKWLIIAVAVLITVTVIIYFFGDKIFKKKNNTESSGDILEPQNVTLNDVYTPAQNSHTKSVGDTVYSASKQQIARVELKDGHYTPAGYGMINKGTKIGTVVKLTPNGYYIKAANNLKANFYYVGTSQIK